MKLEQLVSTLPDDDDDDDDDEAKSLMEGENLIIMHEDRVEGSKKLRIYSAISLICLVITVANLDLPWSSSINSHELNPIASLPSSGLDGVSPASFHQSSFGGLKNIAHPAGARAMAAGNTNTEVHIPISRVERAIPSLHRENILNYWGHYAHDEHRSPFASFLYARPDEELEAEQAEYTAKMAEVRSKWGSWNFFDEKENRPIVDLGAKFEYKDFTYDKLDEGAWQKDDTYVSDFLIEARMLIERVTEGIYAEYGQPTKVDDIILSEEEIEARNRLFGIDIVENSSTPKVGGPKGATWMTERSFEALSRKLLHAMITNDEFYVTMGGHSAAAGHGNNNHQEYMLSFHHLMEPVFHKLGVRLLSRNLAMGGLGTLHFSLGAKNLYGESDFLIWDSSMTEKGRGDRDLFNKQALLSGERVPIIFTNDVFELDAETGGTLLHGDFASMTDVIPITEDLVQVKSLPWATQYMRCSSQCNTCKDKDHKYSSSCWVPRKDFHPKVKQSNGVGGTASWHPGNREHQLTGRKIALTMLHGLKAAIDTWEQGIKKHGFPLKETYWHVGAMYKTLQTNLKTNLEANTEKDECEKRFPNFSRACHVGMSGMGEYTPRATGYNDSIRKYLKPAPNGYVPKNLESLYSGIDLMPLKWKVPPGEVDVHAIAIATNYKEAEEINQQWEDEEKNAGGSTNGRQLLTHRFEYELRGSQDSSSSQSLVNDENMSHVVKLDSSRQLDEDEIVPGQGWVMDKPGSGFCDGSTMSTCNRYKGQECLRSGHNDHRGTIGGDHLSGWLVIEIPKLMKGLILARLEVCTDDV